MANEADISLETTRTSLESTPLDTSLDTFAEPAAWDTALDASAAIIDPHFFQVAINFMQDGGTFIVYYFGVFSVGPSMSIRAIC